MPVPVHVLGNPAHNVRISAGNVSRLPSALIGIVLVLTLGILLSQGGKELLQDLLSVPTQVFSFIQPGEPSSLLAQLAGTGASSVSSVASEARSSSTMETQWSLSSSSVSSDIPLDDTISEQPLEQETTEETMAIPRNPYTVTGVIEDSFPSSLNGGTPYSTPRTPPWHASAPPAQPASGPATWVILSLSLAAMAWISRGTLFCAQYKSPSV